MEERSIDDEAGLLMVAARWHDRLTSGTVDLLVFQTWLNASPDHAQAYALVQQSWASARAQADEPEILAIRHETLARTVQEQPTPIWRYAGMALAASLVLMLCATLWIYGGYGAPEKVQTASVIPAQAPFRTIGTKVGERLTITLEDGSKLYLDTDSSVKLRYTLQARQLVLEKGQALFDVAKDPSRPFTVTVGGRVVTAYGTRFNIKRSRQSVEVALIEGSVGVRPDGGQSDDGVRLRPNDRLVAYGDRVSVKHYSSLDRFLSWREGVVQFDNLSLADAVEELNRYLVDPIHIGDARVGAIRISGSFPVGSSAAFLEAVQFSFPAYVDRDRNGQIMLRYRFKG